ncbi:unnamed protein product [Durusdinium trenchii]|uniref:Thioesterase domain-containing protein n=1 Tax=Durusdinium trenchii TaxID=1381693 RepID=A0ABP0QRN7_9DINO
MHRDLKPGNILLDRSGQEPGMAAPSFQAPDVARSPRTPMAAKPKAGLALSASIYAGWQLHQAIRAEEDPWQHHLGQDAQLLELERHKLLHGRQDKQFIWQTCTGPGKIEECKIYRCARGEVDREVSLDAPEVLEGKTRICAVLHVGHELNGHPGLLHGGFTSAILDDFTGLATWMEKDAQDLGQDAKIFTAHLDLSYRRPLPANSEYLVEANGLHRPEMVRTAVQSSFWEPGKPRRLQREPPRVELLGTPLEADVDAMQAPYGHMSLGQLPISLPTLTFAEMIPNCPPVLNDLLELCFQVCLVVSGMLRAVQWSMDLCVSFK